ncbi:MAG TPA: GNAT family N-acetyltransferase [Terriglobales bacterium]|nr:GNAT family N-acetyltransferase [Terriglobales bacterium]
MPMNGNSAPLHYARVRLATPADMAAIIDVVNAAFSIEKFLEGTRTDRERMTATMHDGEILVMEDGSGRIVASVYVEVKGERGYFGMLAVDPAHQGKGLGRAMITAAENFCRRRGCKIMDIAVLSLRPELPPFYENLGYGVTGAEDFHPSRPFKSGVECHAILMSKSL